MTWPDWPAGMGFLDPDDFDAQLAGGDGDLTLIRRGIACPCWDKESNQPDESCAACRGFGYLYADGDTVTIPVQWTAHNLDRQSFERGILTTGRMTVTWSGDYPFGFATQFVHPIEEAVAQSDLLTRGRVDPTGYSLERLRHDLVTEIEVVRDRARVYVRDTDWRPHPDDPVRIDWIDGGTAPAAGERYAVRYRHRSVFVLDEDLPKLRHDGGQRLPFTAQVVRFEPTDRQKSTTLGAP